VTTTAQPGPESGAPAYCTGLRARRQSVRRGSRARTGDVRRLPAREGCAGYRYAGV